MNLTPLDTPERTFASQTYMSGEVELNPNFLAGIYAGIQRCIESVLRKGNPLMTVQDQRSVITSITNGVMRLAVENVSRFSKFDLDALDEQLRRAHIQNPSFEVETSDVGGKTSILITIDLDKSIAAVRNQLVERRSRERSERPRLLWWFVVAIFLVLWVWTPFAVKLHFIYSWIPGLGPALNNLVHETASLLQNSSAV